MGADESLYRLVYVLNKDYIDFTQKVSATNLVCVMVNFNFQWNFK